MRSRGAWRLRATISALCVALVAGCAESRTPAAAPPTSAASSPVPAVQAKVFVPALASVSRTAHGTCWTTSITVGSRDAYRCYAGNQILDPCFAASADAHSVICYADPWAPGVRLLFATKLPKPAQVTVAHPWALQLANGKRCVAATGVVDRIGSLALLYHCRDGGEAGTPAKHGAETDVRYLAPGTHATVVVPVAVVWQG